MTIGRLPPAPRPADQPRSGALVQRGDAHRTSHAERGSTRTAGSRWRPPCHRRTMSRWNALPGSPVLSGRDETGRSRSHSMARTVTTRPYGLWPFSQIREHSGGRDQRSSRGAAITAKRLIVGGGVGSTIQPRPCAGLTRSAQPGTRPSTSCTLSPETATAAGFGATTTSSIRRQARATLRAAKGPSTRCGLTSP